MKQRIITGALLILLLAVMLWLPDWCMAIATLICTGFAVWEEYHALSQAGHRVVSWPTWLALVASLPLTHYLGVKVIIPLLAGALLAMVVQILFREQPELTDLSLSALPLLTVALPGLSLVALALVGQKAVEVVLLSLTYSVPLMGDMVALFVGSAVGGPKLCPAVSPKKTVSGSLGNRGAYLQRGDAGEAAALVGIPAAGPVRRLCRADRGPVCFPGQTAQRDQGFFQPVSGARRNARPAGQRAVHGGSDVLLPAVCDLTEAGA